MKIKTQIALWVGLLSFLIILLTGMGVWYVDKIKEGTDHILTSNHLSIQYSQNMLEALDQSPQDQKAIEEFRLSIRKQKNKDLGADGDRLISRIEENFEGLPQSPNKVEIQKDIRQDIVRLMQLNMEAIAVKSNLASRTAKTAIIRITMAGTACFAVAFILFLRLPRSIAEPIAKLIEGTHEIAQENYTFRIHMKKRSSEFKNLAKSFNDMAGKLDEYDDVNLSKLWIEKKRIEIIINSIYDPIIVLDENRIILFINNEALKLADLKTQEVLGKRIEDMAQTNIFIHSVVENISRSTEKKGKKDTRELKLPVDGEENYFEIKHLDLSIDPSSDKEKKIGAVILLQNITPYKKLDIAKTNFIASLSHNFRTPISSSQIGLHLLKKNQTGKLNDEQKELVDSIEEDIQRLLSITGDLLKISEVESENIQLKISPVNLQDIIGYAVRTIQKQADRKRIRLEVNVPDEVPIIQGDAEKIAWVLINLISNAIRYSKENSMVRIQLENKIEKVYLFVKDQGQGIPLEYKDKIFMRYFRAPGGHEKGTGLGLAIGKEFMEAQGGSLKVESELGKGSTFTMILRKERHRLS